MSKLNPDGDWVPYKVDDIDHEDDDAFWDGTKKYKRKYKKGSDNYGHIVLSKNRYDRRQGERRERLITTRGGRRARPVVAKGAKGARRSSESNDFIKEERNSKRHVPRFQRKHHRFAATGTGHQQDASTVDELSKAKDTELPKKPEVPKVPKVPEKPKIMDDLGKKGAATKANESEDSESDADNEKELPK